MTSTDQIQSLKDSELAIARTLRADDKLAALIDAAREAENAIDAWGKTDVSDPAEAEKDAVLKSGHALYLALLAYDADAKHRSA